MTERADLEAAILADPDAREAYAVYADHLLQHGDPDGELVAVQLALEDRPHDEALKVREAELVAERAKRLGRLFYVVMHAIREPVWKRGVLHSISVRGDAYSSENADACAELITDPDARFLRDLHVRAVTVMHGTPTPDDGQLVASLAAVGLPAGLRGLYFDPMDFQLSWTRLTDLEPLYRHMASVERLAIVAGEVTLGHVQLPALRELEIVCGGLPAHVLHSIANATWPRMERLSVYLGTERYGGTCTLADLEPILGDALPPGVTSLGLCNSELGDDLASAVLASKILPRLARLELSGGTLGDEGARLILANPDRFRHLAVLDLSENYLTPVVAAELATTLGANVLGQRLPDVGERYCAIAE